MKKAWATYNQSLYLFIKIKCKGRQVFRVFAHENKPNSNYADRIIKVDGERTIYFSLPVTPKALLVECYNVNNPKDKNFEIIFEQKDLLGYNIALDQDTVNFLKLATPFSQICGFEKATTNGRIMSKGKFKIRFYDIIRDAKTNKPIGTPSRIGHSTGIIDVAKIKFDPMTIAMRMIILLHEFSHKYKNPKIGLEINNEIGADLNALYIYLGLGFSKVDALYVYANIFLKAQSPENMQRMRKIQEYITDFEAQKYASKL